MKDIVEQLRHDAADKICPYFAVQTMEIAANEIVNLRIISAQHRDGRLAALEELAKNQGPALDVDVKLKLKPIARYTLLAIATVLGWLVIAANGASWGLSRLQSAAQTRAELLR